MKRFFNTAGACDPQMNYMVDIHKRLEEIGEYYVAAESPVWCGESHLITNYCAMF